MGQLLKEATFHNTWFCILSAFAVVLIIASFIVPPVGEIDSSVLAAVGEVFAFAALGTVIHAIDKGVDAKVQHGQTSLTVGDLNNSGSNGD